MQSFMKFLTLTLLAGLASAFQQVRPASLLARKGVAPLQMAVIDPEMPGQLAPVGFFDPLGLSKAIDDREFRKWREAEIKHGRIAMLAAVGLLTQEIFHPLFGGRIMGPGIWHFQQATNLSPLWFLPVVALIGFAEAGHIMRAWETPDQLVRGSKVASIKAGHLMGDLGFDPLNLSPPMGTLAFREMQTKELQNGRLAMLAAAGIVAQELTTYQPVLGVVAY